MDSDDLTLRDRIRDDLRPILGEGNALDRAATGVVKTLAFRGARPPPRDSALLDFRSKTDAVIAHFEPHGLTREHYLRAAVRQPSLFLQNSASVIGHVEGVVHRFASDGLTLKDYLASALKQPTLFSQEAGTLIRNVEEVVRHFAPDGLTLRDYLAAAVRHPPLFYQRPETLIHNVEGVAHHFAPDGLAAGDYLAAALKQPSLFCRRPEAIIGHVNAVASLCRRGRLGVEVAGGEAVPAALRIMLDRPILFCLSDENLALRDVYAAVTGVKASIQVLSKPRGAVERELEDALSMAGSGRHARNLLLRALTQEGWVSGQLGRQK